MVMIIIRKLRPYIKCKIVIKILDLQNKWKNLKDNFQRKCVNKSGMAAKKGKEYTCSKV